MSNIKKPIDEKTENRTINKVSANDSINSCIFLF